MRINEVEIYTSKQIIAFIEYLKVVAEEKKVIEDMQSHYQGNNVNFINSGSCLGAAQATPEYMAKLRADTMGAQVSENTAKESITQ